MEVDYLKKDELQYELQLRRVPIVYRTVDDMRPQLRSLLSLENSDQKLHYPKYNLDSAIEIKTTGINHFSRVVY